MNHKDYSNELSKDVREKTQKNLVYVAIFSVAMLFAGLTSAYIVSMGDRFWVSYPLPSGFWISTSLIILSSIFFILAINAIKKGNSSKLKLYISMTLVFGLGFTAFQFVGYKQLNKQGAYLVSPVFVTDGKYGDYFHIKYKGDFIDIFENKFTLKNKPLNSAQMAELKAFALPFKQASDTTLTFETNNANFTLFYQGQPLQIVGSKFMLPDGSHLLYTDLIRLQYLAWNIEAERVEFYHAGTLGKDFQIYYQGEVITYKNKDLMFGNKKLSVPLQNKANASSDIATSFLYIITALHLLHVIATLFYLIRVTIKSFKGAYTQENHLGLSTGSIFWHFLGLLWVYLLLFLHLIH